MYTIPVLSSKLILGSLLVALLTFPSLSNGFLANGKELSPIPGHPSPVGTNTTNPTRGGPNPIPGHPSPVGTNPNATTTTTVVGTSATTTITTTTTTTKPNSTTTITATTTTITTTTK